MQPLERLTIRFVLVALTAGTIGIVMTVAFYGDSGWADVGKALLALAATFAVGGVASTVVKVAEQKREDASQEADQRRTEQAAWRDLLADVVLVDQTVAVARQLIAAHKTAKTYSEQYANLVGSRLILRRIWFDPLIANEPNQTIRYGLDVMKSYLDDLGREYESEYLVIARQQRVDEEYLKLLSSALAESAVDKPGVTAPRVVKGNAVYQPTPAWYMLQDLPRLRAFLGDEYERSQFITGYSKVKPLLEERGGIQSRTGPLAMSVLSTTEAGHTEPTRKT